MKKKVFIINQFANTPDLPGHTRQYDISKGLALKGWLVDVFASDFNLSERNFKKLRNFEIVRSEVFKNIKWYWLRVLPYKKNNIFRYLNIFSFCLNLFLILTIKVIHEKLIKKNKLIIIGSSPQLPSLIICLLISKIFSIPFLSEIRDLWPQVLVDLGGNNQKSLFIRFLSLLEKIIYKYSKHIIVLAKGSINYVKERGGKNISFLPNGSDLNKFKFYKLNPEDKDFSYERPFTLTYYGTHGEANGLNCIIEAAKLLKDRPIKFLLLGDGPTKNILIKNALDLKNIIFLSPISKHKMPEFISQSDAVIITLKNIPLFKYGVSPNKLYDAYAIGRPIISNIGGDIGKEIDKYGIGFNSESEDAESLAKSIINLMNLPRKKREEMSKKARYLAETKYSREIIVSEYNKILNKYI